MPPAAGRRSSRSTGLPPRLARIPYGVLRPVDAAGAYAHPRPQLSRLAGRGALHRLATGYYALVPPGRQATGWRPSLEAAAYGIAASNDGPDSVALMGLSAARIHAAIPRALAVAVVATPRQRPPVHLVDRAAEVLFVRRDTQRLDAERASTDLGTALVTGVEQTVLDLAHRPELEAAAQEATAAVRALLPRADPALLDELAGRQRLRAARDRALHWAG